MAANEKLMVADGIGEFKIYFDERIYKVEKEGIITECASHVFGGELSGYDLERLDYGEIVVYYNPIRMDLVRVTKAKDSLVEYIEKQLICAAGQ